MGSESAPLTFLIYGAYECPQLASEAINFNLFKTEFRPLRFELSGQKFGIIPIETAFSKLFPVGISAYVTLFRQC
jgi:hypothetical protein